MGCHALLQGIFLIQGSNLRTLRLMHWQDGSLLGPPGKPGNLLVTGKRDGWSPYQTGPKYPCGSSRFHEEELHLVPRGLGLAPVGDFSPVSAASCQVLCSHYEQGAPGPARGIPILGVLEAYGVQSNMGQVTKVIRKLGVLSRVDQLWEKAPNPCLYIE